MVRITQCNKCHLSILDFEGSYELTDKDGKIIDFCEECTKLFKAFVGEE